MLLRTVLAFSLVATATLDAQQSTPAAPDAFLDAIRAHCGKAYEGRIINPQPADTAFATKTLVMHVRECGDSVRVPFHVGTDRSRTWIFTRTPSGARLKHDHRHADGSEDAVTQYGGDAAGDAGPVQRANQLEFFADSFTVALIPAARTNVWTVGITADQFIYQLRRTGSDRRFRVEFDLTKPVTPPPAPWGAKD